MLRSGAQPRKNVQTKKSRDWLANGVSELRESSSRSRSQYQLTPLIPSSYNGRQTDYADWYQRNEVAVGSNSLEQLLDDIVTDRCFLQRIKMIQDLGGLVERIKTTMKYSSKHQFISQERAAKIVQDMAHSAWLPGSSNAAGKRKTRRQKGTNSRQGQGGSRTVPHSQSRSTKSKIQQSPSIILQNAGYGSSATTKGRNLLDECNRALEELNSEKNNFPFRIIVPRREMTLPLRTAWKSRTSSHVHYRENRSSRLRAEYLSRHSLSRQDISSSSRGNSRAVSNTFVQCTISTELESSQYDADFDTDVECSSCITDECSNTGGLINEVDYNDNLSNATPCEDNLSSETKRDENLTFEIQCEDNARNGIQSGENIGNEIPRDGNLSKEIPCDNNGNTTSISQEEDEKTPEAEFPESFECYDDMTSPSRKHSRSIFDDEDSKDVYDEIIKFRLHAGTESMDLEESFLYTNPTPSSQNLSVSNSLSLTSINRSPSALLTPGEAKKTSRSKASASSHGSQGDINLKNSSHSSVKSSSKVRSYPASPSASFLNILNCTLQEVECFHFQRQQSSPMTFDNYGNTDENFKVLLGLVGFPEIVRRKFLSKRSSPIVQAIITRNKLQDGTRPVYVLADSSVNSEDSIVGESSESDLIQQFNYTQVQAIDQISPRVNLIHPVDISVSKEPVVSTDSTMTLTSPVQELPTVDTTVDVDGNTKEPTETNESVTTKVLDTIHIVADKLVDDIWDTMMTEFTGLLFPADK